MTNANECPKRSLGSQFDSELGKNGVTFMRKIRGMKVPLSAQQRKGYRAALSPLNQSLRLVGALLLALLYLPLSSHAETVGQQFRDIMAEIDAQCKKDKLGPYLDPKEPVRSDKRSNSSCNILMIKPVDPLATEEGRFAYSIKLPAPHDTPKVKYQPGMSAERYFKELCEKEAGEWVFKTVEGVEGVFQGRRDVPLPSGGESELLFQLDEAAEAEVLSRDLEDNLVQPYHGRYNYLERPIDANAVGKLYIRFFRGAEILGHYKIGTQKNRMPVYVPYIVNSEQIDTLKSRYGFTWRQIGNKDAIENGIVGGETIIFDRATNDVLAFRRFFIRYWPRSDSRYTRLVNHEFCKPRFTYGFRPFINKVLVPVNPTE